MNLRTMTAFDTRPLASYFGGKVVNRYIRHGLAQIRYTFGLATKLLDRHVGGGTRVTLLSCLVDRTQPSAKTFAKEACAYLVRPPTGPCFHTDAHIVPVFGMNFARCCGSIPSFRTIAVLSNSVILFLPIPTGFTNRQRKPSTNRRTPCIGRRSLALVVIGKFVVGVGD